jgi:hypothetical protein
VGSHFSTLNVDSHFSKKTEPAMMEPKTEPAIIKKWLAEFKERSKSLAF